MSVINYKFECATIINNQQKSIESNIKVYPLLVAIRLSNSTKLTLVNDQYYDYIIKFRWHLTTKGYVRSSKKIFNNKRIYLHRYIMTLGYKLIKHLDVDHIDRNPLNNCINNLRMVTHQENLRNKGKLNRTCSSKFIGVSRGQMYTKWRSGIRHNGKKIWLGYFDVEAEAAKVYDTALRELPIDDGVKVYNFI